MHANPAEEWQRLTRLYAEMSEGELEALAGDFANLTATAQPILRDELKKRGLADPQAVPASQHDRIGLPPYAPIDPQFSDPFSPSDDSSKNAPEDSEDTGEHEYTWKTGLYSCGTKEEAWQIRELLRVGGVESWEDRASSMFGSQDIQILVAADQLDDARAIIARPIPQDIIDQSKVKEEEFVPPTCPKCGAPDPLLENSEPANSWRCDECGYEWTEAASGSETAS